MPVRGEEGGGDSRKRPSPREILQLEALEKILKNKRENVPFTPPLKN